MRFLLKRNSVKWIAISLWFLYKINSSSVPLNFVFLAMSMVMCSPMKDFCQLHRAVQRKQFANYDYSPIGVLLMDLVELRIEIRSILLSSNVPRGEENNSEFNTYNAIDCYSMVVYYDQVIRPNHPVYWNELVQMEDIVVSCGHATRSIRVSPNSAISFVNSVFGGAVNGELYFYIFFFVCLFLFWGRMCNKNNLYRN